MRVIHSSDWHLGHTLRGEVTREDEHRAFLAWLLETCGREAADVLVLTGDVFDSSTPPASAERMWFDFLAAARRSRAMDIVAIAGNHDSPARLGAPAAVLRELGVHVIGSLPRIAGSIDLDRVLIPVAGGRGLVAAVPFLRPVDVPTEALSNNAVAALFDSSEVASLRATIPYRLSPVTATDRSREGVSTSRRSRHCSTGLEQDDPLAAIYGEVIAAARARRRPDQALIVTGHLYLAGADSQFLSERRVSIGGQEAASARLFPDDIDYVALGHIHRAQRVGRDTIRYAGAPIALALDEASYKHQALAIDFVRGRVAEIRSLPVPQAVEILRVPRRGAAPLDDVLRELDALPRSDAPDAAAARPYLEVVVTLHKPEPRLRALVEAALEAKHARLVYLHVEHTGDRAALGDRFDARSGVRRLAELDPREVFVRLWTRDHAQPPAREVRLAFDRLLEEVSGDRVDPEESLS